MNVNSLLAKYYNLDNVKIAKLDGYENDNYLVKSKEAKYVLKTYNYSDTLIDLVQAERDILLQFKSDNKYSFPKPIISNIGNFEFEFASDNKTYIVRLLAYVEGESIGQIKETEELYSSFGYFLAEMDTLLLEIKNEIIENRYSEWNLIYFSLNKNLLKYIDNIEDRNILITIFKDFEAKVIPNLSSLRHSIIHNDTNDFNVMVNEGIVTGTIDFGDLAYAPLVCELAVAIAYSGFGKENPGKWAKILVNSYTKIIPLSENELGMLYYLITARLVTSLLNANYSRIQNPENRYAYSSEKNAWEALRWWIIEGRKII